MKNLLSNPYVSRCIGAIGAGFTSYYFTHDVKGAIAAGATFLVYGAAHSTATTSGAST